MDLIKYNSFYRLSPIVNYERNPAATTNFSINVIMDGVLIKISLGFNHDLKSCKHKNII